MLQQFYYAVDQVRRGLAYGAVQFFFVVQTGSLGYLVNLFCFAELLNFNLASMF